ncbi:MAG: GDP-mannose 4,6-dehydratase [Candidatus Aenigmatarchaeota archaeon]
MNVAEVAANLEQFRGNLYGSNVLVTGGAGFLGSWFCDVLYLTGANTVCVDNLASGDESNIAHLMGKKGFTFVKANLLDWKPDRKFDYIVHMASIASPPLYMKRPIDTLDCNILGTRKLLELAKEQKAKGFLMMSTSEVYGNPPDEWVPTPETFQGQVNSFGVRSMYDEGKRAAEAYCYSYHKEYKVPVRIARTFNTYGPRLDSKETSQYGRALVRFVKQALKNEPITVYGDGTQTRSFCYVSDQISGLFRLLLMPGLDGETVNIGNPKEHSILELAEAIIRLTGSKSPIQKHAEPHYDLRDDPRRRCPDISKAKRLLQWEPSVPLENGLKTTIEWFRGRGG